LPAANGSAASGRSLTKRTSINSPGVKHIPQRTCVACGRVRPKRELVRLVRISTGGVEVDSSGRKSGRGAYLCPTTGCWEVGLEKGRLEHALRTAIGSDNRQQLMKYGQELG
jgi:predicted RNA-binding protein YlxR (DUF448 family)